MGLWAGAGLMLLGGVILLVCAVMPRRGATPAADASPPPAPRAAPKAQRGPDLSARTGSHTLFIEPATDLAARRVHTVLTTRQGGTAYQALVRYQPQPAPLSEVPGLLDVIHALAQRGLQIPQEVVRVDQETEALMDNLGQPLRAMTSWRLYLHPVNCQVIAYDVATSTGSPAQRFVGHLTRTGVTVEVYCGSEPVDRHEMPFVVRDTFIPLEMEFIHQWFQNNQDALQKREPVRFSIFVPEAMAFVMLVAAPLGDEVIPIKDATYECAKYEVRTVSTQSAEGLQARQEMWFDKRSGLLMRRQDPETVTERGKLADLAQVHNLVVRPPEMPEKLFPYPLDQDLVYRVRIGEGELGTLSFQYKRAAGAKGGEQYVAAATVNLEGRGAARHETALTCFDANWRPVSYLASGDEAVDAKATYKVEAKVGAGKAEVTLQRHVEPLPNPPPDKAVQPPDKPPDAKAGQEGADENWHDPLRRVPITDEEVRAQESAGAAPPNVVQTLARELSTGTYLFDFNRIEQLAAAAYRFPLPAPGKDDKAGEGEGRSTSQKLALYAVRQNRCAVVQFDIRPEPKPALTERQKRRLSPAERNEPRLYVASANNALLPCRMLLSPDGRILELALRHGHNEVVYTLDDPIMRHRAERAKQQKLQEGPQLIRPPWW